MEYRIEIAIAANDDAASYRQFILNQSHDALPALRWIEGLFAAIETLRFLPGRCPSIPEQHHFNYPLHHLLYASHRIVFRIQPGVVQVLRVYHSAGRPLKALQQRSRPEKHP